MSRLLPSQCEPHSEDKAFERGFIFGRDAVIKRVREALTTGEPLEQLITELSNVNFNRL